LLFEISLFWSFIEIIVINNYKKVGKSGLVSLKLE